MPSPQPITYESPGQTWAANSRNSFNFEFLNDARSMRFPVVKSIALRFVGTADTGSAGELQGQRVQVFDSITLRDSTGDRVALATGGGSCRQLNMAEYGNGYIDATAIAASQSGATLAFILRLPIDGDKRKRQKDAGIPLAELLSGTLQVTYGAALEVTNTLTTLTGTITVVCDVIDELVPEAKPRLVIKDIARTATDFDYKVAGRLRAAYLYVGAANEFAASPTDFTTGQTYTSRQLNMVSLIDTILIDKYRKYNRGAAANDGVADGELIPIFPVKPAQKISECPLMDTLQIRSSGAVLTGEQVLLMYYEPRDPGVTARVLGFDSVDAMNAALGGPRGAVKGVSGSVRLGGVPKELSAFLPLKVKG